MKISLFASFLLNSFLANAQDNETMRDRKEGFYIGLAVIVIIGLFFLLRSVMLWYWRVNDIVKNMSEQKELLEKQNQILQTTADLQQIQLLGQVKKVEITHNVSKIVSTIFLAEWLTEYKERRHLYTITGAL